MFDPNRCRFNPNCKSRSHALPPLWLCCIESIQIQLTLTKEAFRTQCVCVSTQTQLFTHMHTLRRLDPLTRGRVCSSARLNKLPLPLFLCLLVPFYFRRSFDSPPLFALSFDPSTRHQSPVRLPFCFFRQTRSKSSFDSPSHPVF